MAFSVSIVFSNNLEVIGAYNGANYSVYYIYHVYLNQAHCRGFCNIPMWYLGHGSTPPMMATCCYVECIANLSYSIESRALDSIPPKYYLLNMGCSMWRRNYRFKTHAKIIRAFETTRTIMWRIYADWWKDVLILAMDIWIALENFKYRHWTRNWQAKW